MSAREIVMSHVCPALGCLIANVLFLSPMPAVLRARRERSLGDLNPIPFIMITLNCLAWVVYSWIIRDAYVFAANEVGLLCGVFYTLQSYRYATHKAQDLLMATSVVGTLVFTVVGMVHGRVELSDTAQQTLWGAVAIVFLVFFYTSPLSSTLQVLRTQDSSSIYWPLSLMNLINGAMWTAYGLALKDYFIGIPNLFGACMGLLALVLRAIFPAQGPVKRPPAGIRATSATSEMSQSPLVVIPQMSDEDVKTSCRDVEKGPEGERGLKLTQ